MIITTWILTILSIAGTVLNIKKHKLCFALWIFTNGAWCIYDFSIAAYAQSALFFVYFLLAIWGLWEWRKNK
jgi:nicotinamide riboside transporter PnuC